MTRLSDDDCIVTHSQSAPWIKGDDFAPVTDTVLVNLNCNATVAIGHKTRKLRGEPRGQGRASQRRKRQVRGR